MARRYIVPMSPADIDLREFLPELSQYGIGTLDLVASVFRAVMDDDVRYHLDVANYVKRVIEQQYYELKLHGSDYKAQKAITDEIDRATIVAIELCDRVYDHLHRYIQHIENEERRLLADGQNYYLSIEGYHVDDIIIRADDEPDPRSI